MSTGESEHAASPSRRTSIALLLLGLAHLPLVLLQCRRLWTLEYYQFFPFAFVIFGWLFHTRRLRGFWKWDAVSSILVGLDLGLLAAGTLLNSPWIVYVGALLLCFSVCRSCLDAEYETSLGYLILLPLITLRLPLAYDVKVISWLQEVTTRVGSRLLNDFGFLHIQEGNILEFPGKRFLVEEACSGVQSLFSVLFLASLIVCGYRRRWLHAGLVLISAIGFAGLMNVFRICAISVAWAQFGRDLSTGWQHDLVGYLALASAAFLVFSADAFMDSIFETVSDVRVGGMSPQFHNPLIVFWNHAFRLRTRKDSLEPGRFTGNLTRHSIIMTTAAVFSAGTVLRDWFRLGKVFGWIFGFLERWFRSRSYRGLLISVPFMIFGILGPAFLWWLKDAPQTEVVENYEAAATAALHANEHEKASVYLEGLVKLRPHEKRYALQLALQLLQHGSRDKGLAYLQRLTHPGPTGYNPARLWLVTQAGEPDPVIPVSPELLETHLRLVVDSEPYNRQANRLLAGIHLKNGQWKEAETRLLNIVETVPDLSLPLAKVQLQLRRSQEQIRFHLSNAMRYFEGILLETPTNTAARMQYSETLALAGQSEDAAQTLLEGLQLEESASLKSALSALYLKIAQQQMEVSVLNRDRSAQILVKAIPLDPGNREVIAQVLMLSRRGAKFTPGDLGPAIAALASETDREISVDMLLAELLTIAGRHEEAVATLESKAEAAPQLKVIQASVLIAAGKQQQADRLIESLLADFDSRKDNLSTTDVLSYSNLLMMASRFEDACNVMRATLQRMENSASSQPITELGGIENNERQSLLAAHGRACIGLFEQRFLDETFTDSAAAMQLLDEALQTNGVTFFVLDRLVQLTAAKAKFSEAADETLTRLLATGFANADIYNMLGTTALKLNDRGRARLYLERSYSLNKANPMVLNNLALAIVGQDPSDAAGVQRALDLVTEVLRILPDHPNGLSTRAEIYMAMERWEAARGDLEKSLLKQPDNRTSRELIAKVYDALNEPALAEEHRRILKELAAAGLESGVTTP